MVNHILSVTFVVATVVVVSIGGVVDLISQPVSSSGHSFTPLHHKASLIQTPLVGQRTVPSLQGLQIHSQVLVTTLRSP